MISVIVPNYNHSEFLHRRIDSILNQTCQDFELILLDDCSIDGSVEILRKYEQNEHVSYIVVNEKNGGSPFVQWQRGFDLAKGEYICVAESDDWWEPTILETLLKGMKDGVVLSVCQTHLIDERKTITYATRMNPSQGVVDGRNFVMNNLAGDTMVVNAGMCMFRKSILKGIQPLYLDYKGAGDWMFWIEVALQGNVTISDEALNFCYRHSKTVTSYSLRSGRDMQEGNSICKYAIKRLSPKAKELVKILKQRYGIYVQQKGLYESKDVLLKAKRDLLSMHPLMPLLFLYKSLK